MRTASDVTQLIDLHFPAGGDAFELDPAAASEAFGE
jgi:hypothetical protein